MKTVACARSREAEALRDQRLDALERASFERHLGTCDACSRELRILEGLAAPLRADAVRAGAVKDGDVDELHARRERARLLRAFDQVHAAPAQRPARVGSRSWRLAAAVAALVGAGVASSALLRATTDRSSPPKIAVEAAVATVWSGRIDGRHPKLMLERGALVVRVHDDEERAASLLVVLPDGELEDIGTVFEVRAEAGHTTRVSVREGSVVLRIRGEPSRLIRAGETWTRAVSDTRTPPAAIDAAIDATPPGSASATAAAPIVQDASPRAAPKPRSNPARADPAGDFRAAVELLQAGDNRAAAAALARFVTRHPRDARAEDAAYLKVLALHRAGLRAELEAAADAYLRSHPAGLRRLEVDELARRARDERALPTHVP